MLHKRRDLTRFIMASLSSFLFVNLVNAAEISGTVRFKKGGFTDFVDIGCAGGIVKKALVTGKYNSNDVEISVSDLKEIILSGNSVLPDFLVVTRDGNEYLLRHFKFKISMDNCEKSSTKNFIYTYMSEINGKPATSTATARSIRQIIFR